jgi:hypothetical protein
LFLGPSEPYAVQNYDFLFLGSNELYAVIAGPHEVIFQIIDLGIFELETVWGWELAEWSERCISIPKATGSNPSGGSEFSFCSDLLLTARGGST